MTPNFLLFFFRIRVEENGNLVITKLAASDQGRYVCLAQNIVGIRETSPVLLTVNGKPAHCVCATGYALCCHLLVCLGLRSGPLGSLSLPPVAQLACEKGERTVVGRDLVPTLFFLLD